MGCQCVFVITGLARSKWCSLHLHGLDGSPEKHKTKAKSVVCMRPKVLKEKKNIFTAPHMLFFFSIQVILYMYMINSERDMDILLFREDTLAINPADRDKCCLTGRRILDLTCRSRATLNSF